tara:strand:+ start:326 stop:1045 length:720 start_codon:yes stop_codon:yes gene_type:complete
MATYNQWISGTGWTCLPEEEVDIWKFSLELQKDDRQILSDDELKRFDQDDPRGQLDKRLAGRAHLRRILSKYTQSDPSQISFTYENNRKPVLENHPDLSFNLSHSQNMGLIAVTQSRRVGVDLEYLEAERPFSKIAERFLTNNENNFINKCPEEERSQAFYQIWTLNEAYLKALGTGFSVSSNDFSVIPTNTRGRFLRETKVSPQTPQKWMFETLEVANSYLGALCFEGSDTVTRYWKV